MKTILIATDFSSAASNAAKYAVDMACTIGADVFIFHACHVPSGFSDVPYFGTDEQMKLVRVDQISKLKQELVNYSGHEINIGTEVTDGYFFTRLKDVCTRIKPYTVVIGSHGKSPVERMFYGKHAEPAMQRLTWPIITVPLGAEFSIKQIGLACDFDHVEETVPVDEIKRLLYDFNAKLHVLNTTKKEKYDPEIVFQTGLLQKMLADLKPEYHFITNTDIDEGIIEFAENNDIDLLLVLPKPHGLLEKLFHRSHTKQIVFYSHVPVLAVHR